MNRSIIEPGTIFNDLTGVSITHKFVFVCLSGKGYLRVSIVFSPV